MGWEGWHLLNSCLKKTAAASIIGLADGAEGRANEGSSERSKKRQRRHDTSFSPGQTVKALPDQVGYEAAWPSNRRPSRALDPLGREMAMYGWASGQSLPPLVRRCRCRTCAPDPSKQSPPADGGSRGGAYRI